VGILGADLGFFANESGLIVTGEADSILGMADSIGATGGFGA
jgi:hypothetical protein